MSFKIVSIRICALFLICAPVVIAKKELKLLHVLSVNKFNVPRYNELSTVFEFPNNLTYKYFLHNAVDIPNSIKMHLYNLGVHLRNMYDEFLGPYYFEDVMLMQTTGFPVSIIAGELINAGLWPPVEPQIWKEDLAWQPIPFEYKSPEEDTLLLGTLCPNFERETHNVLKNKYNLTESQKQLFNYINNESKIKVENPIDVSLLYLALENSIELNQQQPKWLKKIFPGKGELLNVTLKAYDLLSTTKLQRQLNGGSFIKKVLKDSEEYIKGNSSSARKINIYSGDERNFAGVLNNLNLSFSKLPNSSSAMIFELFAENNDYFIKMNFYTGSNNETIPHSLESCDLFCPIEKFSKLVADLLPENEQLLCGLEISKPVNTTNSLTGGAIANVYSNIFVSISSLAIAYTTTKIL